MSGFPMKFIDHNVSEAEIVIEAHDERDYNYIVGGSGKGMEVIFQRAADVKLAVMIVDEDWRLKFSCADVRDGQDKSFTTYKELKILKHYAELDIICEEGGGLIIKDVSKSSAGLSALNGRADKFYTIVECSHGGQSSSSEGAAFDRIAIGGFTGFD